VSPGRACAVFVKSGMLMLASSRAAAVALLVTQLAFVQNAETNAADAKRLVAALHVHQGSTVGEIGAGSGELTVALAREVGPDGRIYSNELNADRRREIGRAVTSAGLANVTIVEGAPASANLPDDCCDAIFMRNVYHHFADPAAMNASLYRATKPGGYIAVIDFAPSGAESAQPSGRSIEAFHGVSAESVIKELESAGFEDATSEAMARRGFIVVARRPAGADRLDVIHFSLFPEPSGQSISRQPH
jgi:ubiquinone/menaquinone biosynthesis C-methylase UbiE